MRTHTRNRYSSARISVGIAIAVVIASPALGAGWLATFSGPGVDFDASEIAHAVAIDGAGDIVAAGSLGAAVVDAADLAVVKVSGSDGATLWSVTIDGVLGVSDEARDVAFDASGDVLVAGRIDNTLSHGSFAVVKLSGSDGSELWRAEIEEDPSTIAEWAFALAVDSSGDVVAGGYLRGATTGSDLAVVKLAGLDGSEVWRSVLDGPDVAAVDNATQVAFDASDDVIVGGLLDSPSARELIVLKLSGTDGTEVWRSPALIEGPARGLAFSASGDLYVSGTEEGASSMVVAKLSAVDGSVIWSANPTGPVFGIHDAGTLTVDPAGGVAVAARLPAVGGNTNFAVVKLAELDGAELWNTSLDGGSGSTDIARVVVADGAGNLYATGKLAVPLRGDGLAIVKLNSADGNEIWRRNVYGTDNGGGFGFDLALAPGGDPVAVGQVSTSLGGRSDLAVVRVPAADGFLRIFETVGGKKILVRDKEGDPSKRKIVLLAKSFRVEAPVSGGPDDPLVVGATFRLVNPTSGQEVSYTVPGGTAFWKALGKPAGSKGYSYVDRNMLNGPCKKLLLKPGKFFKALCLAREQPIDFTLDDPTQGSLTATLEMGTDFTQCVHFGGTVIRDEGLGNPKPIGTFLAKDVAATPRCVLPGPPQ